MTTPNEIEHEEQLIKKGQQELFNELQLAEERNYYSSTKPGRYTAQNHIESFIERISTETEKYKNGKPGRKNLVQLAYREFPQLIEFLTVERIGVVALKVLIDCYCFRPEEQLAAKVSSKIGMAIEDEVRSQWNDLCGDDELANIARKKRSMPGSNPHYRRYAEKNITQKKLLPLMGETAVDWSSQQRTRVGAYLLEIAEMQGLIELRNEYKYGKQQKMVHSDRLIAEIQGYEHMLFMSVFNSHPLVDTPKDWQQQEKPARYNNSGGYHLERLRQRQYLCRGYIYDSRFGDKAINLLNVLQRVAWRVDVRVLSVAEHLVEKRISVGKLIMAPFDRPEKGGFPEHVVNDPDLFAEEKRKRSQEHKLYTIIERKGLRSRLALGLANQYRNTTYYLSWSCDWRGRMYSQQPWLGPQASDLERSLIKFRDGCKLNKDGLEWVKAAIGAAFNGSRISFAQRIEWTNQHQDLVRQCGEDPLSTITIWEQAKDPWQFLQLCIEWVDVVVTEREKFWKVPIGADSTASGLQLLSGMLRDPVGMKYSNLLEPDSEDAAPKDAYMKVLEVARSIASENPDNKDLVPYLKDRSVGKPALMLSIYGGSHQTIQKDIEEALLEEHPGIDKPLASRITSLVYKASKKVFPKAYQALAWMKKLAKAAHEAGATSLTWSTPTGDTIHCIKYEADTQEIYTAHHGKMIIGDLDTERPDTKKQVSSFAPSFVHSYDAALLKEAFSDWKHPIALIHDQVSVLPNDMDRALDRIRDAFTTVVDGDPLGRLEQDLQPLIGTAKRPKQGDVDLDRVQRSRYMFN